MTGAYGKQLGEFIGVKSPPAIEARILDTAEFVTTHLKWDGQGSEIATRIGTEDAHLVFLQRRATPANPYWIDGRPIDMRSLERGQSLILNLNEEHRSIVSAAVDSLAFYIPRSTLDRVADEQERPRPGMLRSSYGKPVDDAVIWHLGECLVPVLQQPNGARQLFIDTVSLALATHLTNAYAEPQLNGTRFRGGLAAWQERRAKEMLLAHMDGNVSLDVLAAECQLSRSHFAHAFKASTGISPLRWLHAQRIERAKRALMNSDTPLVEIAEACGFSDASHLSRSFRRATGQAPGWWRRLHRDVAAEF